MALDACIRYNSIDSLKKFKMLNNMVIVEVFDERAKTKSGISVPITIDNPFIPDRGIIFNKPSDIKAFEIGDEVIIEKYKGTRMYVGLVDVRQFIVLDAAYILAVINK